jgi:hypothetical protein
MIKNYVLGVMACMLFTPLVFSQQGLPQWPLVTAAPQYLDFPLSTVPNEFVDWTALTPGFNTIPGTSSNRAAPTQVGINACNQMVFFALHNGNPTLGSSFLRLFAPDGTPMPLPGADMRCNIGDDEVQVIRRPGFSNQWFVVYSRDAAPSSGSPAYTCSNLAYSLIEVNGMTATYVSDMGGAIQDRALQVSGISRTYMHGKATSRLSVVPGFNHDIYVQRRAQGSNTVLIDRFSINGGDAVIHTGSSTPFNDYWWYLMASGSPLELSPTNDRLAVMARSDIDDQEDIYIFDISTMATLANPPIILPLCSLQVEFTTAPAPLTGLYHRPVEFASTTTTTFEWLRNFERKINGCEFSPNGQYLYITGGGYVASGTNNITYLGQIDLLNTISGNNIVRLQVESSDNSNSYLALGPATGGGNTWPTLGLFTNYWDSHQTAGIESCFDGNFYFTKTSSQEIFVLPNTNLPLPINMTPHIVDMSLPPFVNNVPTAGGYAIFMPDQIDGWDYSSADFVNLSFIVSNQCYCGCDTLSVTIFDEDTNAVGGFFIDGCPDTVSICVPNTGNLTFVGSNGVTFTNAVIDGSIIYPAGSNVFGFGCMGNTSGSYQIINSSNNLITTDAVWEGKYIFEDNTILTVDGATLDLTNVDLIFGTCSGIDFINGANVRANNSVFRPCAIDHTWRGLRFTEMGEFDNIINESTFKNAEIALYFNGLGGTLIPPDAVISNNLFSNCNEGVRISSIPTFDHPISGNRIVIDNFYPSFGNCYPVTSPTYCYGILGVQSTLQSECSQNEFIYSRENNAGMSPLNSFGIVLARSRGMISENTFTNYRNPIFLSRATASYIDNNEIEYNNDFQPSVLAQPCAGISVFQTNAIVEITNNEIRDNSNIGVTSYGIYSTLSTRNSARHNTVDGFDIGIYFYRDNSIEITENLITKPTMTGIWFEDLNRLNRNYITCNDITMPIYQGVGIYTSAANQNTNIISNCVKDSKTGIATLDPTASRLIPYIRNNYIYNYQYGIFNNGHSGNIGTSADPGLNTLWSNDNLAVDINSTTNITVADNFGMFNISFPFVMISSNNPYHSTASCAHQIFNMPSQGNLNTTFVCDNTNTVYFPLIGGGLHVGVKNNDLMGTMQESVQPLNDLLGVIQSATDIDEQELENAIQLYITDENEKHVARFYLYSRLGNKEAAKAQLLAYTSTHYIDLQWKDMELLYMEVLQNPNTDLGAQIEVLKTLAETEGPLADLAVDILQLTTEHVLYPYPVPEMLNVTIPLNISHIEDDKLSLQSYPNPVHDVLNINIITDQEISDYTLSLQDITGKKIAEYPIQFVAGQYKLNVEDLANGVYVLSLHNNDHIESVKFIKQ